MAKYDASIVGIESSAIRTSSETGISPVTNIVATRAESAYSAIINLFSIYPNAVRSVKNTGSIMLPDSFIGTSASNEQGILLDVTLVDSNASNYVDLVITPTFTYNSSTMVLTAHNKLHSLGKYELIINGLYVINYGSTDSDIANITYTIDLTKVEIGDNQCRLNYKYPDQSIAYIDFVLTKEAIKRSAASRSITPYAGGYTEANAVKSILGAVQSIKGTTGTIKTTDATNFNLAQVKALQNLSFSGSDIASGGAVSFDGRNTWYTSKGVDKHTLALLSFNGDYTDLTGKIWTGSDSYVAGGSAKVGTGSAAFSATNKYMYCLDDSFALGIGDFTYDYWMYRTSGYVGMSGVGAEGKYGITISSDNVFYGLSGTVATGLGLSSGASTAYVWRHYALVRKDGVFYYFVDGVLKWTYSATTCNITSRGISVNTRYYGSSTYYGVGYYDNFRISNIARWTEDFTPPIFDYSSHSLVEIAEADIPTFAGPMTAFNFITEEQWNTIFQKTQLDFKIALNTGDVFSSLSATFTSNFPPTITDVVLAPSSLHSGDTTVSATIADPDGDNVKYQITVNGTITNAWTTLATSPVSVSAVLSVNSLPVGDSLILLEASDGEKTTSYETYITRTNDASTVSGILTKRKLEAVISDTDADTVRYRILLNGVVKQVWSDYLASPASIAYIMTSGIVIGVENTLTVEVEDSLGGSGSADFSFVGQSSGPNYAFIV